MTEATTPTRPNVVVELPFTDLTVDRKAGEGASHVSIPPTFPRHSLMPLAPDPAPTVCLSNGSPIILRHDHGRMPHPDVVLAFSPHDYTLRDYLRFWKGRLKQKVIVFRYWLWLKTKYGQGYVRVYQGGSRRFVHRDEIDALTKKGRCG